MAGSLNSKRIAVTGGAGFLGSPLVERLRAQGADPFVPRSKEYDLRSDDGVRRFLKEARPDVLIHLAASVEQAPHS